GGSARTSESDVQFTERLKPALSLVDITLLDLFIVTAKETCSLRDQGYM
ncbi:JAB domain-containing protein, partial [Neisseria sp. P0001.S005]